MRAPSLTVVLTVALALLTTPAALAAQGGATPPSATATSPEAEVREVVEAFGRALAAADSIAALGHLHPDVVVYEGGHAETLEEYRSHHLGHDIAFLQATEQATTREQVTVSGDVALSLRESATRGRYRDREVNALGTETLVLVRTPEGWKIRHIHWSSRNAPKK